MLVITAQESDSAPLRVGLKLLAGKKTRGSLASPVAGRSLPRPEARGLNTEIMRWGE